MRNKVLIALAVAIVFTSSLLFAVLNGRGQLVSHAFSDSTSGIALMLQNDDLSTYSQASSISNSAKYVLNRTLTKCEAGGSVISYNRSTGVIEYSLPTADMCYVYFDQDKTGPTFNTFYMGGSSNPTYLTTWSTSAYLTYVDTYGDIKDYCVINSSSSSGCTWTTIPTSTSLVDTQTLTPSYTYTADGTYTMYAYMRDIAGNITTLSDEVIVDKTAPTGFDYYKVYQILGTRDYSTSGYSSVGKKNGSWTTNSVDPIISFNLEDIQGIMGAYIKLGAAVSYNLPIQIFYTTANGSHSETYSAHGSISAGSTEAFIKFNHTATNWTKIRFDIGSSSGLTYTLAELGVFTTSSTESGVSYVNWAGEASTFTRFIATDATSGVASFQYYGDGVADWTTLGLARSGGLQVSGTTTTGQEDWGATDGRNQSYNFRACDKAGNCTSTSLAYNIKYDLSAPSITTGGAIGGTNITFAATDSYSGVKQVCMNTSSSSISGCIWQSAANGSNTVPVTYTTAGTYYLHVRDYAAQVAHGGSFVSSNYTVTYNANGGSVSPTSHTLPQGVAAVFPTPSRTCYKHLGWSDSSTATSGTYANGYKYTGNASKTVYATWQTNFTEDFEDDTYPCVTLTLPDTNYSNGNVNQFYRDSGGRLETHGRGGDWVWDFENIWLYATIKFNVPTTHAQKLSFDWGVSSPAWDYVSFLATLSGSNGTSVNLVDDGSCSDNTSSNVTANLAAGVTYTLSLRFGFPSWYNSTWMWVDNVKVY